MSRRIVTRDRVQKASFLALLIILAVILASISTFFLTQAAIAAGVVQAESCAMWYPPLQRPDPVFYRVCP